MSSDYKISDRMQSALAHTHHVQNRIAQCLARGKVSPTVAEDVARQCQGIIDAFSRSVEE
jgi:hypothetical protein